MGMFDTVVVQGLRLNAPKDVLSFLKQNNSNLPTDFQTKDLENCLYTYKIDKNKNFLVQHGVKTGKKVKREPLFLRGKASFLEKLYSQYTLKDHSPYKAIYVDELRWVDKKTKVNSDFEMYSYQDVGGRYLDIVYKVSVSNGKVKNIKYISHNIESELDAKKRHQKDLEWNKQVEREIVKRKKFHSSWYYPIIRETYNPFVFFSRKLLLLITNKISNSLNRWHGL